MFWLGLGIGLVIGGNIGVCIMAVFKSSKR